ncbi:MAG: DUF3488 domain-containing transglutaminase family protein [Gammaproteobacteria bacterium]|nr:DUF3488 domain-containing transglutaminase family protein [Gammaproteobacteria bacterium]
MELAYQIPRAGLIWVLSSVVLALAPQSLRLPIWVSIIAAVCIAWRILIFMGKLDYPGKSMRVFVVLCIAALSISQIRSLDIGLEAATTLLALGFVFKLIEMQNKRDIYVVLCLCFVMALVSFIYSESVLTTIYFTLVIMVTIGTMVSLNRSASSYDTTSTFQIAVRIIGQSIPLMIVLFLAFPRIAPLWSVPMQSGSATIGVSDEMSPGDISRLGRSTDLAFRVTFENSPPPLHANLYWRGLVLDYFDGTTWRRQDTFVYPDTAMRARLIANAEDSYVTSGESIQYNIILEPTRQPWLYGLHLAEPLSAGISRGYKYELFDDKLVTQRKSYDLQSFRKYETDLQLPDSLRNRSIELPEEGNERSKELATSLRAGVESDRDFVYTVLSLFQQQEFYYTLNPPLLGDNRIDDFLFNTREGFCEHYASAFTYMMRAAGVPARVVVGYQGAEYNRFEDYMMVYQYNAHAWTEVWLEGEGWVRFDPTSIVSPDRINLGVEAALQNDPDFMGESLLSLARFRNSSWGNMLRLRMDAVEYEWNRRVVGYGQEERLELFENLFGKTSEQKILMVMLAGAFLVLLFIALVVLRVKNNKNVSATEKLYRDCCRDLEKIGLGRQQGEGPMDYYQRVVSQQPALEPHLRQITDMYIGLNYAPVNDDESLLKGRLKSLRQEMRHFRVQLVPFIKKASASG